MTIEILEEENLKVKSKQDMQFEDTKQEIEIEENIVESKPEVNNEVDNRKRISTSKKPLKSYVEEPNEIVEISYFLLNLRKFQYIVICPPLGLNYYYDNDKGCYNKVSEDYIERFIDQTLISFGVKFTHLKIRSIYKQVSLKKGVEESDTKDTYYVCFSNGLYNLHTQELIAHTPEIFCTDNLGFPYLEDCPISHFMDYLNKFCSYQEEKKNFLRY
jgi:hypothetical protein